MKLIGGTVLTLIILNGLTVCDFPKVFAQSGLVVVIDSDTTWTTAYSPYELSAPVRVNNGATLTIEPGVIVNFNNYYILVDGILNARGNSHNQIELNNGQIKFSDSSEDWDEPLESGSIIENAILTNIEVIINGASPRVTSNFIVGSLNGNNCSSVISNNNITGQIDFSSTSSCLIFNNTITSTNKAIILRATDNQAIISGNIITNAQIGISLTAHGTVSDNKISDCKTGISIAYYASPIIQRNTIRNNTLGVHIYRSELLTQGTPVVRNNTITNNSIGVFIERFSLPNYTVNAKFEHNNIFENGYNINSTAPNTIEATNNWWGSIDIQTINETIIDVTHDFTGETVNFIPFLNEPNSGAEPSLDPIIPEFPSWLILPFLLGVTLAVAVIKKKML